VLGLAALLLAAGSAGCGGSEASVADFCRQVKRSDAYFRAIAGHQDAAAKAATQLDQLAADSPGEIKSDVAALADAYGNAAKGESYKLKDQAAKLTNAARHVAAYAQQKCGLDLNAT
jgi:hypothetical protein